MFIAGAGVLAGRPHMHLDGAATAGSSHVCCGSGVGWVSGTRYEDLRVWRLQQRAQRVEGPTAARAQRHAYEQPSLQTDGLTRTHSGWEE